MSSLSNTDAAAWLARRAGFGHAPGEHLETPDVAARLDALTEPDRHGIAEAPPVFGDLPVSLRTDDLRAEGPALLSSWITHQAESPRPLEDIMAFFWHDHFAISIAAVPSTQLLRDHLELLRRHALGNFAELLRAVTVDAAMLVFLDGARSNGASPNENYGRELLELYALGVGNYDEGDVRAAAVALTGWTIDRDDGSVRFAPYRHDDTPQTFLGQPGVHDVDTVIDAVIEHPACAAFVAGKVAAALLGSPVDEDVLDHLATTFRDRDLEIAPLVRATLEVGLDGGGRSLGRSPVHLLSSLLRTTGARPQPPLVLAALQGAGQVPGNPPNVGGFPDPDAWFAASTVAARFSMASAIADATPADALVLQLVAGREWDELAALLARPQGFEPATTRALDQLSRGFEQQPDRAVLAAAFASPEVAVL